MASTARDTLNVESGVQQRTLNIGQGQSKRFAMCGAIVVVSVVSAMVGYSAAVLSVGPTTHSDNGLGHNTASKLDRATGKAFHVSTMVRPGQPAAAPTEGRASVKMQSAAVADIIEKFKKLNEDEMHEAEEWLTNSFYDLMPDGETPIEEGATTPDVFSSASAGNRSAGAADFAKKLKELDEDGRWEVDEEMKRVRRTDIVEFLNENKHTIDMPEASDWISEVETGLQEVETKEAEKKAELKELK